jgi:hypothetical protein
MIVEVMDMASFSGSSYTVRGGGGSEADASCRGHLFFGPIATDLPESEMWLAARQVPVGTVWSIPRIRKVDEGAYV